MGDRRGGRGAVVSDIVIMAATTAPTVLAVLGAARIGQLYGRAEGEERAHIRLTDDRLDTVAALRRSADAVADQRDALSARLDGLRGRIEALAAEYERDDLEHLSLFGQHHPVAAVALDHLRDILDGGER